MNKSYFIKKIKESLRDFSKEEVQRIIEYYEELINDYIDEGYTEEEAIEQLGDIDNIIKDLKADLVIERSSNKNTNSLKNFLIVLSITTSPVLIPIGIAFFVVFISILISLFGLNLSFALSSILLIISSIYTTIEMSMLGTDPSIILITLGGLLFSGALMGLFSIGIYKVSKTILNFINKQFSKILRKRNKKEANANG